MPDANPDYLIHSSDEMARLERQAAMYGAGDDLAALAIGPNDRVLDVGCGAGAVSLAMARAAPGATIVGVDRETGYVAHARSRAAERGIANASFQTGEALSLPFPDASFDIVWSKHVLQWIADNGRALAEMVRVVRPGGRVVAGNFDGFLLQHWPCDDALQAMIERWFETARARMGFDPRLGRKLAPMFVAAGLCEIDVTARADAVFSGLGGDPERQWNLATQLEAVRPFSTQVFGSAQAARDFEARLLARFADPAVYFHCTMFHVSGRRKA